jgi:hypothetical protein
VQIQSLQANESALQRRSAVRYQLQLPVIFHWNDGVEHTEGGFTCDVALDGALIRSAVSPPVGAKVQVEVLLMTAGQSSIGVRVQCSGTVTRVSDLNGMPAFGVQGVFDDDNLIPLVRPSRQE